MVKLVRSTLHILSGRQTSIFSAASVIMVTVFLSRILGLFRDRLLAANFAPAELGVYYAAFRIPNMMFELLVMGALAAAFIPVFTSYLNRGNEYEAFFIASSVINIGVAIFGIISIPLILFTRQISHLLAPGFNESQIMLMTSFTRIMIVAQVFPLIIGNFFTGILQSYRSFFIPAIAPVVYNIGIILAILFLSPFLKLYAPVVGVVAGAVLFVIVQLPFVLSLGYRHAWQLTVAHPGTREVGRLMLPRTLGLAVSQIDTTVDLILATILGASTVTVFNFAQHLQQVPIGLFGVSIAQAALPTLSSLTASKDLEKFKELFISSFHQILFLIIPISSLLIVLRIPMVRLVFGASNLFDWNTTVATGKTVAFFSISLFAQALVHLLARSFYALHDSKTPVAIGAISVILNAALSIIFVIYLQLNIWALGLSASIASIFNTLLLLFLLDRRVGYFNRYELIIPPLKIFLSGLVTGIFLYVPIKLLDQLVFDTTQTFNLLILTGISVSLGGSVYLFLAWFLDIPQITVITKVVRRAKRIGKGVIIDTTSEVVS